MRPATVSAVAAVSSRSPRPTASATLAAAASASARAGRVEMRADRDVLAHGQPGERLHDLERARDAAPRKLVRRLAGDVGAVVEDAALGRREEARDDREQRGLAGAVRSDQRGDAAGVRGKRCAVDGEQAAEAFRDVLDAKQRLSHGRAPRRLVMETPDQAAHVGDQAGDAARRERHDEDQHAAIDDEIEARRVAGHELGQLAERLDHQRAEQRAEHRADPADDRREQRLDRDPRPVGDAGIDEQEILRVEAAGRRGDGGRDRHGRELDGVDVDAERLGGVLVLAHRHQIGAEPAVLDHPHDDERRRDQRQRDEIERHAALELERLGPQIELDQRADAGAGDRRDAGDDAQHLGKGERHEREVRALEAGAEAQRADDRADQRARRDRRARSPSQALTP